MPLKTLEIHSTVQEPLIVDGPSADLLCRINVTVYDGQWGAYPPSYNQILSLLQLCQRTVECFPDEKSFRDWRDARTEKWNKWLDVQNNTIPSPQSFRTWVYVMRCNRTKLHKIGRAKNPSLREKTLQSESPSVEMIFKVEAERSYELELHKRFEHKRVRGEWFRLTKPDVKRIMRWNGK